MNYIGEAKDLVCDYVFFFFFFASFREHYIIMHKTDFYVDA